MSIEIKVKYRNGLPTEKCMRELIYSFWGEINHPRISDAYKYNGTIVWQRNGINERVDEFVGFLTDKGINIKNYSLYESMSVGHIWITKNKQP